MFKFIPISDSCPQSVKDAKFMEGSLNLDQNAGIKLAETYKHDLLKTHSHHLYKTYIVSGCVHCNADRLENACDI